MPYVQYSFMDLPVSSFVFHSSLLTAKSVDLMVPPREGFLEIIRIFYSGYFNYRCTFRIVPDCTAV